MNFPSRKIYCYCLKFPQRYFLTVIQNHFKMMTINNCVWLGILLRLQRHRLCGHLQGDGEADSIGFGAQHRCIEFQFRTVETSFGQLPD